MKTEALKAQTDMFYELIVDSFAGGGEFAVVTSHVERYNMNMKLGRWPEIRALLNRYCGYQLADDEILPLRISGADWYINDIGLRMLTPRELYNAMGFPTDYIIDRDYLGNEYGRTKQVARCGNAVCPPVAEALARANYKAAAKKYETMDALMRDVAVYEGTMKQYCRYCVHLATGNGTWCAAHERGMSDSAAKRLNHCKDFDFNEIDAFFENQNPYRPREPHRERPAEEAQGEQMNFWEEKHER